MRRWVGRSVVVIGVLHTIIGIMVFGDVVPAVFRAGFFNTIGEGQPDVRNVAFWFFFCGFLLLIFGGLLDHVERSGVGIPMHVAWGLAAFAVAGAMMMPQSGFWLLMIPVVGVALKRRSPASQSAAIEVD